MIKVKHILASGEVAQETHQAAVSHRIEGDGVGELLQVLLDEAGRWVASFPAALVQSVEVFE